MGRNLYILGGTLGFLAIVSAALSFTPVAMTPGDVSLWRTMGIGLLCLALIIALAGVLSSLFEQAERRATEERMQKRRRQQR